MLIVSSRHPRVNLSSAQQSASRQVSGGGYALPPGTMLYDKRLGNAMNSKKAVKKLDKITGILTSVIDGLPDRRKPAGVQKLLGSAKKAVAQARKAVKA